MTCQVLAGALDAIVNPVDTASGLNSTWSNVRAICTTICFRSSRDEIRTSLLRNFRDQNRNRPQSVEIPGFQYDWNMYSLID